MNKPNQSNAAYPPSPATSSLDADHTDSFSSIFTTARRILRGGDISNLLQHACENMAPLLGTNQILVMSFQPEGSLEKKVLFSNGIPPEHVEALRNPSLSLLTSESFDKESFIVIPDIQELSPIFSKAPAAIPASRTACLVPITVQEKPFGGLYLFYPLVREFSTRDRQLAETLGDLIALAAERGELNAYSREHLSRLNFLQELNRKITENLSLNEVLKNIVQAAVELLGGDYSRIFLFDSSTKSISLAAQSDGDLSLVPPQFSYAVGEGLTGKVFQKRKEIRVSDVLVCPDWEGGSEWARHQNIRSFIAQPLLSTDKAVGVINCQSKKVDFFKEEDLELLAALASQATVAIQNAQLHEEARRSRNFFRSVVEDNADAIIVTDKDRRVLWWNAGAEKLYGYTEVEAMGNSVLDLIVPRDVHDDFDPNQNSEMDNVFFGKGSVQAEVERIRKDGTVIPVDITLSPVKDDNGDVVAICSISKDLTHRMATEDALKEAKEAAEAASRAKGEFLSNVSHELRSPLNAVIGFSDLLLMSTKDEEALRLLPKIRSAGKYLSRIIDDLRDVDRFETGKMQLDFTEISMNNLIQNLVESRIAHLPGNFQIEQELDSKCGPVICDPTRISQVINNLLDNAIKYSPEGGTIRISSRKEDDEIWVGVQDQGMGISPDQQELIFERFQQLGNPARGSSGLGIGLYLVRHILTLHNGRIWVESERYKGSKFSFAIPFDPGQIAAPALEPSSSETSTLSKADPWDGRKVLLVDDLEMFHEYISLLMKSASAFYSAFNGQEGIEVARAERPDLILMDLRMPVLDGFGAIEQLKADSETKDIPIIAVTAQAMEQDRSHSLDLGANGFVTKPVDLNLLKKEIEHVFSGAKQ